MPHFIQNQGRDFTDQISPSALCRYFAEKYDFPVKRLDKKLKNQQEEIISDQTTETATRLLEIVRGLDSEIHPGQKKAVSPTLDSSLDRDLGFDSLAQVELLARIEKSFNVTLSEQILATVDTVRDLLRAVLSSGARKHETVAREIAAIKLD